MSAIRPVVERLESRLLLTVVYNPVFGPDIPASSAPFGVLQSPTDHVILWGTHWTQSFVSQVVTEVTAILGSTYLGALTQYGASGQSGPFDFYVDSSSDPPSNFNPGALNDGHSLGQAESEITKLVNQGHVAAPNNSDILNLEPIYTIIDDPVDSPTNGGYNTYGPVNFENVNIDGVGTSGTTPSAMSIPLGSTFSHETSEITSDPAGSNSGVIFNSPPNEPTAVGEGVIQVADGEPEPAGQAHYYYRIGGPSSQAIVQAIFSEANQAFIVNDGNSELFELYPNWTLGANNNDSFNGNYALVVNGDQQANKNDTIVVGETSSGGVSVTLDGQNVSFDPNQITSVTINSGVGSDSIYVQDTIVPTTINSSSSPSGPDDFVDIGEGSTQGISTSLTIANSTGYDQLLVDDSQDSVGKTVTVGAFLSTNLGVVQGIAPQNIFFTASQTRSLVVDTGTGDNVVDVAATVVPTTISGHATGGVTQLGSFDFFDIGGGSLLQNIAQNLTLQDTGLLTITVDDSADTSGRTLYLENSTVPGFGEIAGFTGNILTGPQIIYQYSNVLRNLTLETSDASNTVNVYATGVYTIIQSESSSGDTVNVGDFGSVAAIDDTLSIDNPGHLDAININDELDNATHTVIFNTVSPYASVGPYTAITGLAPGQIQFNDADTFPMILQLGSGTNTVDIAALSQDAFERIVGGAGNDTINLSPANENLSYIAGSLDIVGGTGTTSVFAYDNSNPNPATYTLDYGFGVGDLDRTGFGGMAYHQIQNLSLIAGLAADVINVQNTAPGTTTSINSAGGEDAVNVGESGLTNSIQGPLDLRETAGEEDVTINDSADTIAQNVELSNATASGFGEITQLTPGTIEYSYADTDALNVLLGSARNTVHVNATGSSTTFSGGRAGYFATGPTATATISNMLINGGSTSPSGITNSGTLNVFDSIITGNSGTGNGAGVTNLGTIDIVDCAISANSTTEYGGGLYNQGTMDVDDSTISNNYAFAGAAVYNNSIGHLNFDNSIAFFDLGGEIVGGGVINAQYSDIQQSGGPGVIYPGQGNINENPDFVNGSFQLQSDSPCINAGNNLISDFALPDLAGHTRIVGGTVDMGAYEYQGANPPRTLVFSQGPPATINVNVGTTLIVYVENQSGALVTDPTTVTLSLSGTGGGTLAGGGGGGAPTALAFGGMATFNNISITAAGTYVITASATYLGDTPAVSATVTVKNPASVPGVIYLTPPPASFAAGTVLPAVVAEVVLNGAVDLSYDSIVSLEVNSVTIATTTAIQGVATFNGLVFNTPGSYEMAAYVTGFGNATASFTVTPPVVTTSLVFGPQPLPTFYAGQTVTPGLTVTEVPSSGTLSDSTSFVTLTLFSGPAGGTLGGTLSEKVSNDVATFGNLTASEAGTYEITATDGNDVPESLVFQALAPAAAKLVFSTIPGYQVGSDKPVPTFTVSVENSSGAVVTSDDSTISVIVLIPNDGAYGGTSTVQAINGVATFSNFYIGQGYSFTLQATDLADGLTGVSQPFLETPGPATYIYARSGGAVAGTSTDIFVQATDVLGNVASSDNSGLSLALDGGPGPLGGTLTTSFISGNADFDNVVFDTAGVYELTVTEPDNGLSQTFDITVTANPTPAELAFIQQPSNTSTGYAIDPSVTVGVEDQFGNLITTDESGKVTLSIASATGSGAIGGVITAAVQNGIATFSQVSLSAAGTYTLLASNGSDADATSASFKVLPPTTIFVDQNATGKNNGQDWPDAFVNLQSALAIAVNGDRIDVAQGDYSPGTDPTDTFQLIDGVTIQGGYQTSGISGPNPTDYPTALDGMGINYHVVTADGTDSSAVLDGFTITNGNADGNGDADSSYGGGLIADGGSPTIQDCTFTNNTAVDGGAIYLANETSTAAQLVDCVFTANSASTTAGAIYDSNSSPTLVNCLFNGNTASQDAAAVYVGDDANPILTNCTFTLNSASYGGAVESDATSDPILTNCILWNDNAGGEISYYYAATVTYCDVEGGFFGGGAGNIDVDPQFVNPAGGDFQLQETSLCIDAGSNVAPGLAGITTDLAANPRIINGIVDIGAYEAPILATIYVDQNATGADNGKDWADAYTNLQTALSAAAPGDHIDVAQGDYPPGTDPTDTFQLVDGLIIQGGYETGGVNGPNPAAFPSLLDGMGNNYHVVTADGTNGRAILNGFTITAGDASGDGDTDSGYGGGLIDDAGAPTIIDCTFTNNTALYGGAIYNANEGYTTSPTLIDCAFTNNTAVYDGGAIDNSYSSPTIVSCLFTANTAAEAGGAVYNFSSLAIFTNCTITLNSAAIGGAVESDFNSDPTLTNCILWDDTATGGNIAANEIYTDGESEYSLAFSDISDAVLASTSGNIDSDPQFVNPAAGNFQLQPTSPCINIGSDTAINASPLPGPNIDLAGNPRIFDTVVDAGAYEAQAVTITWTGADDGISWGDPLNWSDDLVPTQSDAVLIPAGFANIQVGGAAFSVGAVTSASPIEIQDGGSLTLYAPATLTASLTIDAGGSLDVTNDADVSGNIIDDGNAAIDYLTDPTFDANVSGTGSLTIDGPGTVVLDGDNSYTGGTNIESGALVIANVDSLPVGGAVVNNAVFSIEAGASAAPVISGPIIGAGTLSVGTALAPGFLQLQSSNGNLSQSSIMIAATSTLDITNNTVEINFTPGSDPITTLQGYIRSGYNGDRWTGPGIVSSNAALSPGLYAVGYVDGNLDAGTPAAANQILIKNTVGGDANLDGIVNFADLLVVAQNFNRTLDTHGNAIDWADGDFNYDGKVNFADLLLVAQNFNKRLAAGQSAQTPESGGTTAAAAGDASSPTLTTDTQPATQTTPAVATAVIPSATVSSSTVSPSAVTSSAALSDAASSVPPIAPKLAVGNSDPSAATSSPGSPVVSPAPLTSTPVQPAPSLPCTVAISSAPAIPAEAPISPMAPVASVVATAVPKGGNTHVRRERPNRRLVVAAPPALPTDSITNDALVGVWSGFSTDESLLFSDSRHRHRLR
jgi:autotransporter-associated beta strand protein